jgi:hypothetical protein
LLTFVFNTLDSEPASVVALLLILLISVMLDFWWKRNVHAQTRSAHPHKAHISCL